MVDLRNGRYVCVCVICVLCVVYGKECNGNLRGWWGLMRKEKDLVLFIWITDALRLGMSYFTHVPSVRRTVN